MHFFLPDPPPGHFWKTTCKACKHTLQAVCRPLAGCLQACLQALQVTLAGLAGPPCRSCRPARPACRPACRLHAGLAGAPCLAMSCTAWDARASPCLPTTAGHHNMQFAAVPPPLRPWLMAAERRVGGIGYAGVDVRQSVVLNKVTDDFTADAALVDVCMAGVPLRLRVSGGLLWWFKSLHLPLARIAPPATPPPHPVPPPPAPTTPCHGCNVVCSRAHGCPAGHPQRPGVQHLPSQSCTGSWPSHCLCAHELGGRLPMDPVPPALWSPPWCTLSEWNGTLHPWGYAPMNLSGFPFPFWVGGTPPL